MLRQVPRAAISDTGYLLRLVGCLAALLAVRLVAVYAARTDLVLDEAQYWTWSRELAFGYFSKPPMIAWVIRGISEICGNSEACIRSASPILYSIVSVVIFFTARALYDARVGFWSAIIFATLPGVSYSSLLITTDVPLILCWSIMLYAWVMLVKRQSLGYAILLGVAIGFGLLAKQAMLYAFLCIGVHAAVSKDARDALKGGRGVVAAALALLLFAPNVIWNAQHDFPTVKHTESNIGWQYPYIHPLRLLEYVGVQFAVFGPILLVVLLRTAWREIRHPSDRNKLLLLSFSLPVLGLLVIQALLSRAHGNWSATAYPAGSILVTAVMLELNRETLFKVSLALHLAFAVIVAAAPAFAQQWRLFEQFQFLRSVIGWHQTAEPGKRQACRSALRLDPRRLTRDGGGAALLSSRRRDADLCLAARRRAARSLRDDAPVRGGQPGARALCLAQALPRSSRQVVWRDDHSQRGAGDAHRGEVPALAFLPSRRFQGNAAQGHRQRKIGARDWRLVHSRQPARPLRSVPPCRNRA